MKIFVFGNTGMLGRYVYSYFTERQYDVVGVNRLQLNINGLRYEELRAKLFHFGIRSGDVVINCIGLIKQRNDTSNLDFVYVNSVFPLVLADVCEVEGCKLIHPTTDCVYDGLDGMYTENNVHNALDVYGKSKSLGEPNNATVIRTSIIGEELTGKRSLLEWVKSQKNKQITGYTNHFWNGITCLQFAKVCHQLISDNFWWSGVRHVFSNVVTKYELVSSFNDIFKLNIDIIPKEVELCDRSLSTIFDVNDRLNIPILEYQIEELLSFKLLNV